MLQRRHRICIRKACCRCAFDACKASHDLVAVQHTCMPRALLFQSLLKSLRGRCRAGAARTAVKASRQKAGATRGRAVSATARKKGTAGSGRDVPEAPSPLHSVLDALLAAASAAQQVQEPWQNSCCHIKPFHSAAIAYLVRWPTSTLTLYM